MAHTHTRTIKRMTADPSSSVENVMGGPVLDDRNTVNEGLNARKGRSLIASLEVATLMQEIRNPALFPCEHLTK